MRLALLAAVSLFTAGTLARAATLPVGTYTLTAGPGSGIHLSDPGSLTGTLIFNAASALTSANLTFHDTLTGETDLFDTPGPTSFTDLGPNFLSATIGDSANPAASYFFAIRTPSSAAGSFGLTCGVDCDTYISNSSSGLYEEVVGAIVPATPEPSSLLLLGTGALFTAAALRGRALRR
jgi:hypothetical protein